MALRRIGALASRAGLDAETRDAAAQLACEIGTRAVLREATYDALVSLAASPRAAAIARLRAREHDGALADALGERAPLWHAVLALLQLPAADARHRAAGIDPTISTATWLDLGLWCEQFRSRFGIVGFSLDILDWAQSYLRGGVLRIGAVQWALRPFVRPIHAFRHARSGEHRCVAEPGAWFGRDGAREASLGESDARVAAGTFRETTIIAHPIDTRRGVVELDRLERLDRASWRAVHDRGTPMLELHIPDATGLDVRAILRSYRAAERVFARLEPGRAPRGVFGESWLLDPQVRELLPRHANIASLQRACALFPGRISEAKTIRRCFGPSVTRRSACALARDRATGWQRKLAGFLADPDRELLARGALVVIEQIEALERALGLAA
jgi:hypothetical protein